VKATRPQIHIECAYWDRALLESLLHKIKQPIRNTVITVKGMTAILMSQLKSNNKQCINKYT